MDPNLIHLEFFMTSGLAFLAKIYKSSRENHNSLQDQINIFIEKNKEFGINIEFDNEYIKITYKGTFICLVNCNDYE